MPDLVGKNIGRYHLVEQLGTGGMATVYKAFDTRLERQVAIKVIRRDAFPVEQLDRVLMRFDREAKTLAQLIHPNIVGIIDYGDFEGSPYLVMEYLLGGTLKQRLGKPMSYRAALQLLLPVAQALAFAHQKGVVHRDVKPANILITEGGQPMLTDFGIAKILEDDGGATLTGTGVGVGTPEYMAPEQGMGREIDGRADVYALGVVLYELVTGRKPFTADTPMAVIFKHLTDPLPRPRDIVPDLPDRMEQIIFKAMAKKPEDRYQSMNDFVMAMTKIISNANPSPAEVDNSLLISSPAEMPADKDETDEATFDSGIETTVTSQMAEPVVAHDIDPVPSSPEKLVTSPVPPAEEKSQGYKSKGQDPRDDSHSKGSRSFREKNASKHPHPWKMPWLKWILAAIGVVIIGAIVWGVGRSVAPAVPTPEVVPTLANLQTSPTKNSTSLPDIFPTQTPSGFVLINSQENSVIRLEDGRLNQIVFSPDEKILAAASSFGIYLYDASTLEQIRFLDMGDSVYSVAFSPDGRTLASSGSDDATIKLWDAENGALLQTLQGHNRIAWSVAFSPNGRRLVSGSYDKTIKLWDAQSGALLQTLEGQNGTVSSVAFSPDGRTLASGSNDCAIKLWDAENGALLQTLEGHSDGVLSVAFSPDGRTLASGSNDWAIKLWDAENGALLQTLQGHKSGVSSVAFSPDGRRLASGSYDKTIKLWDTESGALLQILQGHKSGVSSVAFSPDGRRLASGSDDATIKMWDAESGALLQTLEGHNSVVTSVAFSPDGRRLASGSYDKTIKLWDAENGALLQTLQGHIDFVLSVAFSPDGRRLASGSNDNDKTIKLWDAENGALLQTLEEHTYSVNSIAYSPNNKKIASGSLDGTIRIWDIAED